MYGVTQQFTGLFDRNFTLGYFVPAILFLAANLVLLDGCDLMPLSVVWAMLRADGVLVSALALVGLVALAISLMVWNVSIVRFREGYGRTLARIPLWRVRQRLLVLKTDKAIRAAKRSKRDARPHRYYRSTCFPRYPRDLLPFLFGNAVRAFETYPQEMYGFEATCGWSRLLAVVPKDYRELLDSAKAEVDYLVNVWFLSIVLAVEYLGLSGLRMEYVGLGWRMEAQTFYWAALGALVLASVCISALCSVGAAVRWGELVKGAFDTYLPSLHEQLGLPRPATREEEAEQWTQFSYGFLFRDPKWLPPGHAKAR
jgi:hypothetical protein